MSGDQVETMSDEPRLARTKEFAVVKRSIVIGGHKTSVSLEDAFWTSLKDIAGDGAASPCPGKSPRSTSIGRPAICHPRYGCSCSITSVPGR